MEEEKIYRMWRIVYSNSHEEPFATSRPQNWLCVQEEKCEWDAIRLFWRFYWVTNF